MYHGPRLGLCGPVPQTQSPRADWPPPGWPFSRASRPAFVGQWAVWAKALHIVASPVVVEASAHVRGCVWGWAGVCSCESVRVGVGVGTGEVGVHVCTGEVCVHVCTREVGVHVCR